MAFHLRSVSLPSKRLSNEAEAEAELCRVEVHHSRSAGCSQEGRRDKHPSQDPVVHPLGQKAQTQFKKATKKTTSDKEECKLVRLLVKARLVAASLLESTVCLVSKQVVMPRRSLVSKALQKRSGDVCKEGQLQALECIIGNLEHGAELQFRRMIQSRVSLLNILSS